MTPADTLLQAYRRGNIAEISEAEVAHQDERLAAYGDRRSVHHADPPGYRDAFYRVLDEQAAEPQEHRISLLQSNQSELVLHDLCIANPDGQVLIEGVAGEAIRCDDGHA